MMARSSALVAFVALVALVASAAVAGCGDVVDPVASDLPSAEGYSAWDHFDYYGNIAGHGESWRAVFVNSKGRSFGGAGRYPVGTVIVKEIRNLGEDAAGAPVAGGLRYIGIMRKVGDVSIPGVTVEGGWVITRADSPGAEETHLDLCWATCHRSAPVDGAFYNYGE